ncbi:MAG: hypothetical protein ACREVL_17730 [Solimonas sp.]
MSAPVYLVDRLTAKPGRAQELLRAYRERYMPGAQARGLRLQTIRLSPPLWLDGQANTLEFVWVFDGAIGFWTMTQQARLDATLQDWWWREVPELIEARERYLSADIEAPLPC